MVTTTANPEGFKNAAEFLSYLKTINQQMADDYKKFLVQPDLYRLRDPQSPEHFRAHIVTECADGRNSLLLFIPKDKLLERFDMEWLPFAGNIIFPEIAVTPGINDISYQLRDNQELRKLFFERLDFLCGDRVAQAVQEFEAGKLTKVYIEFQAHFDSENDHHGCGAHKSNLLAAQLETIKDCQITEAWLSERYPAQFQKGLFQIFRTTHDTGEEGHVYRGSWVDFKFLKIEEQKEYAKLLVMASQKYESPVLAEEGKGLVRYYQSNPTEIATEEHDEQVVRLSNLHFATTLFGQSVMEISWTDSAETLYSHVKILLGIIEKNWRAKHLDKPAIVHFDLIKGNQKMLDIYQKLQNLLAADQEVSSRLKEGTLLMVTTETDKNTYLTQELKG